MRTTTIVMSVDVALFSFLSKSRDTRVQSSIDGKPVVYEVQLNGVKLDLRHTETHRASTL